MRRSTSKDDSTKRAPPLWYADEAETETPVDILRQPLHVGKRDQPSFNLSTSGTVNSSRPHQSGVPDHASSHAVSLPQDSSTSLTLVQFAKSYSDLLPAEIMVVEGANSSPVALSDKDILKVDRIKQHSMVLARANKTQQYLIPFNAAIEFCMLYDPESNTAKALKGYSFEKVSDLISAEVKPKLVCARSSWEDKRTGTVVVNNREVFAVGKKVISSRRRKQKKGIKMYSITKHVTKELPEDCVANFSTKPSLLPLYLAEIMEYAKSPFPCKAVLHDEGLMVPPHFSSLVRDQCGLILNLVSVSKKLVMEATYNRDGMESPVVMEIPVELPLVKIRVLQCSRERRSAGCNQLEEPSNRFEGTGYVRNLHYHDQEGEEDVEEMDDEEDKEEEEEDDEEEEERSIEEKSGDDHECFKALTSTDANDTEILQSCRQHSIDPKIQAAPMSLGQFVQQYGHCLPARVKIVESSLTTGSGTRVDEIYKVHFVTGTGGISMIDDKGFLVLVSTDSSTQFGVVYNPHKDLDEAVKGYTFESVDDVVRATLLPRVLCASKTHKSSSPASSIEAGEVLIVQKVEVGYLPKTSALTVYSINSGTTKNLQSDCKGYFSTDPSRIQLHVSTILQHVPSILPTVAMMYLAGQGCGAIISDPAKVKLLQHHLKPCLVATTAPPSRNQHQLVEIPLDASVRMIVVEANFHDARRTANFHRDILLPPEMHRPLLNVAEGDVVSLPAAYNSVTDGQNAAYHPGTFASRTNLTTTGAHHSKPRSKGCRIPSSRQQDGIALSSSRSVKAVPSERAIDQYETLSRSVADLIERLTALAEKVASVEGKLDEHVSACKCNGGCTRTNDTKPAERQFVESLTSKEVLRLLDVAGLGAYSESFDREKIDGQLLCMLNDTLLQQEFKMFSGLHRLKLLGMISGTVDVRSWMEAARPARNTTV